MTMMLSFALPVSLVYETCQILLVIMEVWNDSDGFPEEIIWVLEAMKLQA